MGLLPAATAHAAQRVARHNRTLRADGALLVRAPDASERDALLAWLDDGLRSGRRGRLEAEYPTALARDARGDQRVAYVDGRPVAHAIGRLVEARVNGLALRVGLVGLVYTDPVWRGRGLASACVEACAAQLAERGALFALLWSDLDRFYARLGFHRAGCEWILTLDRSASRAALRLLAADASVAPPCPEDWPALEALYAARPLRARREPGELARLAAAPEVELRVARRRGDPVAYAALGRGDDFRDVVHEWAGEPAGVVACLDALLEARPALQWLVGPEDVAPAPTLRAAGATRCAGHFALARLLDAVGCWRALAAAHPELRETRLTPWGEGYRLAHGTTQIPLSEAEGVALLLGPHRPRALVDLPARVRSALARALPCPVYLWGFDSV